ncbi:MAG: phosphate--acyl-ACP acyltransferase, partial [Candidatus Fimenecus sp.]
MNILIDAFGGDNAPLEIIKGALDAQKEYGVGVTLVGDTDKIKTCAKENNLDISALQLLQADEVFEMETQPTEILK